MKKNKQLTKKEQPLPIFSGKASEALWKEINSIKKVKDARWAIYSVCCKLQELEARIDKIRD